MLERINHGDIREIRFARPPVNAIDPEMMLAINQALVDAQEAGVEGVVISGQPGMFSAGLDVPSLLPLDREAVTKFWLSFFRVLETLARFPVPVVAAMTGHSPAGGTVISIFCDRRIAADGEYRIGLNEVQVGLMLPKPIFDAYRLLLGQREAERLAVIGALILPDEALSVGLVDEICELDQVVEKAIEMLRHMLSLPRQAMLNTRKMARQPLMSMFDHFSDVVVENITDGWFSEETQTTLTSLFESPKKK